MPRLPAALEPAFPLVKRLHRFGTRAVGTTTRRAARRNPGGRRVPYVGTELSEQTLALEPDHVRIHPGGPAHQVHRTMPSGEPAGHWYFDELRDVTFGPRFTLEIADGVVVGNYAAHLTPGGVLDFETSPYFDVKGWHEHPIYLRRRLPEIQRVPGTLLSLATRGTHVNYYHVLMDLLERYAIFAETLPDERPDALLVNTNTRFAREYLALLGLDGFRTIDRPSTSHSRPTDCWCRACPTGEPGTALDHPWLRENLPAQAAGRPGRPDLCHPRPQEAHTTRRQRGGAARHPAAARLRGLRPGPALRAGPDRPVRGRRGRDRPARRRAHQPGLRAPRRTRPRAVRTPLPQPGLLDDRRNLPDATYRYLVGEPADTRPPGSLMHNVYDDIRIDVSKFRDALDALLKDG